MDCNFGSYLLSFLIGIVSSFIASLLFSRNQKKAMIKRNIEKFEKLNGEYQHFENNKIVQGNTSKIFFEEPNLLKVITESQIGNNWEGIIVMNELSSNTGQGTFEYKYLDRKAWGEINIQIGRNEELLVDAVDKETNVKAVYIMKKITSNEKYPE